VLGAVVVRAGRRIPAVSTKQNFPSGVSITVSTASRVVPGMSWTIERSSPTSRLKSVDFPALGRPTNATRGMSMSGRTSSGSSSGSTVGSRRTTSSRRSPVPRPCSALIGHGSPRPSETRSQALASRLVSSTLLPRAARRPERFTRRAISRSSSVAPTMTSVTIKTTSASANARSDWPDTLIVSSSPRPSQPPVSMMVKPTRSTRPREPCGRG